MFKYIAFLVITACLTISQASLSADSGLITKPSKYSALETIERFESAVKAKGQTLFGRIDHMEAAAKYGLQMRPHSTLLFGRPQNGTAFMQQAGTYTVDAPQKAAV